jgi:SAM-dependent methyltransferase
MRELLWSLTCDGDHKQFKMAAVSEFPVDRLQGRGRVLHVVRGESLVSARLALAGFDVTIVHDAGLAALEDRFDAIVFTHSLSNVASLEKTVEQAARLLSPQGRLVVDDLDAAAPDAMSLRWFHDTQELLAVCGALPAARVHPEAADATTRWRAGIKRDGIVHGGTDMRVAVSARFVIRELRRVEGFYRLIAEGLANDDRGISIATHLRTVERRSIANDTLMAVGLRIVADRADRD